MDVCWKGVSLKSWSGLHVVPIGGSGTVRQYCVGIVWVVTLTCCVEFRRNGSDTATAAGLYDLATVSPAGAALVRTTHTITAWSG